MASPHLGDARCDESGWTWLVHQVSDHTFGRLLPADISGAPVYFNKDRVWPVPAVGISVIWPETTGGPLGKPRTRKAQQAVQ